MLSTTAKIRGCHAHGPLWACLHRREHGTQTILGDHLGRFAICNTHILLGRSAADIRKDGRKVAQVLAGGGVNDYRLTSSGTLYLANTVAHPFEPSAYLRSAEVDMQSITFDVAHASSISTEHKTTIMVRLGIPNILHCLADQPILPSIL
jgi:hypothetical protein